jgi:photosystem II stability/assembly factor-like uncharacterized protein
MKHQTLRAFLGLAALGFLGFSAGIDAAQSSPDGGWTTSGPGNQTVTVLAADPTNALRLFAGTELGIFRTDDGGTRWTSAPTGPTGILALAPAPSNDTGIWAGTADGVFESSDGGASFTLRNASQSVTAIAVDPTDPSTIYAAGNGQVFVAVVKSTDGGATWTGSSMSGLVRQISQLVIDPKDRNHILAGVDALVDFEYESISEPQVLESSDAGMTWTDLGPPGGPGAGAIALAIDPQANVLYAGEGDQVHRSSDGGATWQTSPFLSLGSKVRSLMVDPLHSGTLYAGTDRGAFQSTDSGAHWALIRGPTDFSVNALAFDSDRGVLHAATSNGVWEYTVQPPTPSFPCRGTSGSQCLLGGRFSARIDAWNPSTGAYTSGTAVSVTDAFAYFSFPDFTGDATLPEVLVKMVDASAPPWNSFWVFWGSLTDVPFLLTLTDTTTGVARTYENDPRHGFCGGADITAFPSGPSGTVAARPSAARLKATGETLSLLGGQIQVQITATDPQTAALITGTAIARSDRFGYFSFPSLTGDPELPEVFVKAIDATSLTGTFWFFYSGMTSVPYSLTVHITNTGETINAPPLGSGPFFCGDANTSISPGGK